MLSAIIDLGIFLDLLLGSIVITISWNKDPAFFVIITLILVINTNLFLVKIRSRQELLIRPSCMSFGNCEKQFNS